MSQLLIRAFFGLLLLGQCLVSARFISNIENNKDLFSNDGQEAIVSLQARDSNNNGPSCRKICGSCDSSCSVSSQLRRRYLIDNVVPNITSSEAHAELRPVHKRALQDVSQDEIGDYLVRKTEALVMVNKNKRTNLISLVYATPKNDYTFATLRQFSDYQNNVLNIGTAGLVGCTVLTVVSPVAVYMGHFYESLAFSPDGDKDPNIALGVYQKAYRGMAQFEYDPNASNNGQDFRLWYEQNVYAGRAGGIFQ